MQAMVRLSVIGLAALAQGACGGGGGGDGNGGSNTPPPPGNNAPTVELEPVFGGLALNDPVALRQAPGEDASWYVVEQRGVIRVFNNDPNVTGAGTFLDIQDRVDDGPSEAGLLGMAFHPGFPSTPEVFVSYTAPGQAGSVLVSRISRFTSADGGQTLEAGSEQVLLAVPQPNGNHNGGDLHFGMDGLLYVGFGDGGGAGDPGENGQDTTNLLGTIVRIDVDGGSPYAIPPSNPFAAQPACTGGDNGLALDCPEIFAWGLRNPWRFSFDRNTGDLWTGDVGQGTWEEVDLVVAGGNYGWNDREGAHCYDPPNGCDESSLDPVAEYSHALGASITGGYVYRGSAIPDLAGHYVFADYVSGRVFAVRADSQPTVNPVELLDTNLFISALAEDIDGELYIVSYNNGTVHRLADVP